MRRRSREIPVCALLLASAALLGCKEEQRDCVDQQGRILPEAECTAPHHHGGFVPYFLYGGRGGGRIGDTVFGGSRSPSRRSVMRGGFGGAGEGGGE